MIIYICIYIHMPLQRDSFGTQKSIIFENARSIIIEDVQYNDTENNTFFYCTLLTDFYSL